jgi:hypothetical protein
MNLYLLKSFCPHNWSAKTQVTSVTELNQGFAVEAMEIRCAGLSPSRAIVGTSADMPRHAKRPRAHRKLPVSSVALPRSWPINHGPLPADAPCASHPRPCTVHSVLAMTRNQMRASHPNLPVAAQIQTQPKPHKKQMMLVVDSMFSSSWAWSSIVARMSYSHIQAKTSC